MQQIFLVILMQSKAVILEEAFYPLKEAEIVIPAAMEHSKLSFFLQEEELSMNLNLSHYHMRATTLRTGIMIIILLRKSKPLITERSLEKPSSLHCSG